MVRMFFFSGIFAAIIWTLWYIAICAVFPYYSVIGKIGMTVAACIFFTALCGIVIYFIDRKYYI